MNSTKLFVVLAVTAMLAGLGGCGDITGARGGAVGSDRGSGGGGTSTGGTCLLYAGVVGNLLDGDGCGWRIRSTNRRAFRRYRLRMRNGGRWKDWIIAKKKDGEINEPLVLLWHSYGADDQIRVAQQLQKVGITVDLLIVIDPVTPTGAEQCEASSLHLHEPSDDGLVSGMARGGGDSGGPGGDAAGEY